METKNRPITLVVLLGYERTHLEHIASRLLSTLRHSVFLNVDGAIERKMLQDTPLNRRLLIEHRKIELEKTEEGCRFLVVTGLPVDIDAAVELKRLFDQRVAVFYHRSSVNTIDRKKPICGEQRAIVKTQVTAHEEHMRPLLEHFRENAMTFGEIVPHDSERTAAQFVGNHTQKALHMLMALSTPS